MGNATTHFTVKLESIPLGPHVCYADPQRGAHTRSLPARQESLFLRDTEYVIERKRRSGHISVRIRIWQLPMISSDTPINNPKDDQFGIDAFSQAIAKSIEKLPAPDGTVLAITGPWGSGKSSAVNLIHHHLKVLEAQGSLRTIVFNPWWYSDEQILTRAFFQHLYAGLGNALSVRSRKIILSLGKKLLSGPLISSVAGYFTFGLAGKLLEQASSSAADMIKVDRTIEEDFQELAGELEKQKKRFLIIIDDIDRLTPDQSLLVFRLVKSVGRLPNVIYLLAFDREFAERVLAERFPAERHFLEKIVQAAFEVPFPDPSILHDALLKRVLEIAPHPENDDGVRFRNIVSDVVAPLIKLPRDLVRFMGVLNVSWAAVGEEVDLADLLAIESLRLYRFPVYQAIRSHKGMLCGSGSGVSRSRDQKVIYDETFLISAKDDRDRDFLRTALRRLFPRLDSVWANVHHSSSEPIWRSKRQICSPEHFSSYFRLALGTDVIPRKVLDGLIVNIGDGEHIKSFFRDHSKITRADGRSDVPIVLDDLMGSSERIPTEALPVFLSALFEIADEIDLERDDEKGGWAHGTNELRINWLINALVRDRLPQTQRSKLLRNALEKASLGWSVVLTSRIRTEHWPRSHEQRTLPDLCLVDRETALEITATTLQQLRSAAESGQLIQLRHQRWSRLSEQIFRVDKWSLCRG